MVCFIILEKNWCFSFCIFCVMVFGVLFIVRLILCCVIIFLWLNFLFIKWMVIFDFFFLVVMIVLWIWWLYIFLFLNLGKSVGWILIICFGKCWMSWVEILWRNFVRMIYFILCLDSWFINWLDVLNLVLEKSSVFILVVVVFLIMVVDGLLEIR